MFHMPIIDSDYMSGAAPYGHKTSDFNFNRTPPLSSQRHYLLFLSSSSCFIMFSTLQPSSRHCPSHCLTSFRETCRPPTALNPSPLSATHSDAPLPSSHIRSTSAQGPRLFQHPAQQRGPTSTVQKRRARSQTSPDQAPAEHPQSWDLERAQRSTARALSRPPQGTGSTHCGFNAHSPIVQGSMQFICMAFQHGHASWRLPFPSFRSLLSCTLTARCLPSPHSFSYTAVSHPLKRLLQRLAKQQGPRSAAQKRRARARCRSTHRHLRR